MLLGPDAQMANALMRCHAVDTNSRFKRLGFVRDHDVPTCRRVSQAGPDWAVPPDRLRGRLGARMKAWGSAGDSCSADACLNFAETF